ncbi:MAG: hypothetical protein D3910_28135, partial [Candidatus Electrothrix sp. ATG2]|nr:hypothetical protein [Candidatus Electrothrix sp. ATG2]
MASFIVAVILIFLVEQLCVRIARVDFKYLPSWSKRIWHWLCRGRDVLGGAIVILAGVVICGLFDWSNAAFIITGCVLELAGIAQAIISLLEVRKYFDQPRLYDLFKQWLKAYPKIVKQPNINTASVSASTGTSERFSVGVCPGKIDPAKPLNEKVDLLVSNMNQFTQIYEEQFFKNGHLMSQLENLSATTKR